ncbi:putative sodium-dependent multivitamin transporter [Lycorma delicatula]|uniref:putative sodium-dependent multivitamin transporter n=1 Tax=Lycorma delicatula TaxID=130591 RepID=UPI003F513F3C
MTGFKKILGITDILVLISTLIISVLIGIYCRFTGGKQKTVQEYLFGDQKQNVLSVAFSLTASLFSAAYLLGLPSETYTYGLSFSVTLLGKLIATPLAAHLFYLQLRFGQTTKLVISLISCVVAVMYMAIMIYGPAITLESLTDISHTYSIIVIGIICTFYSTIGGVKAVIFTDVFQLILMFLGPLSIIFTAVLESGGVKTIWKTAEERGRTHIFNLTLDPTARDSFWCLLIGGGITFLAALVTNDSIVQRYKVVRDLSAAQLVLYYVFPLTFILTTLSLFCGLTIFNKYKDCDPIRSGYIKKNDQLLSFYVLEEMSEFPGLSGLFVSGIFAASLSSLSARLNSVAAVIINDYYENIVKCKSDNLSSL